MKKTRKARFVMLFKQAEAQIDKLREQQESLLKAYLKQECPIEIGDMLKVRSDAGRISYFKVAAIYGSLDSMRGPRWSAEGRAVTSMGCLTMRRSWVRLAMADFNREMIVTRTEIPA